MGVESDFGDLIKSLIGEIKDVSGDDIERVSCNELPLCDNQKEYGCVEDIFLKKLYVLIFLKRLNLIKLNMEEGVEKANKAAAVLDLLNSITNILTKDHLGLWNIEDDIDVRPDFKAVSTPEGSVCCSCSKETVFQNRRKKFRSSGSSVQPGGKSGRFLTVPTKAEIH